MKTPPATVAIALPKGAPTDGAAQDTENVDAPEMSGNEDCVPLKSLAMPDEGNGDQMANPEVGDRVSYQVEGAVTRIEGDNAYVKRETINGEPVEDDDAGEAGAANPEDDQERQQLGGMADQMGSMS